MNKALKIGGFLFAVIVIVAVGLAIFLQGYQGSARRASQMSGVASFGNPLSVSSVTSFGGLQTKMMGTGYAPQMSRNSVESAPATDVIASVDKKIIKNGNLSLKVNDTDEASTAINGIAKSNGGEVFSSNFYQTTNNVKSGTLTVKVPVVSFEKTFGEIKKVASLVIQESTTGQDVTEQYTDLKAQLSNAQVEEQTFVRILDRAVKIDDVLAVTRELSRVRGTVERLQGSIKYLESQTDMSTISVSLTEDQNITVSDSWRPFQVMKDAVNSLIENLQSFADFVIRFIVVLLPFFVIWGMIFWFVYRIGRKIYLKITTKNENV